MERSTAGTIENLAHQLFQLIHKRSPVPCHLGAGLFYLRCEERRCDDGKSEPKSRLGFLVVNGPRLNDSHPSTRFDSSCGRPNSEGNRCVGSNTSAIDREHSAASVRGIVFKPDAIEDNVA